MNYSDPFGLCTSDEATKITFTRQDNGDWFETRHCPGGGFSTHIQGRWNMETVLAQLGRSASAINTAAAAAGAVSFAPAAVALGGELIGGGAALSTLGVTEPLAGRTLLPVVASAVPKLTTLGAKFGVSPTALANTAITSGLRLVDNLGKNAGNINIILPRLDGVSGFIRVTLDPTESRIISAGLQTANMILNGWMNGRFTPYR